MRLYGAIRCETQTCGWGCCGWDLARPLKHTARGKAARKAAKKRARRVSFDEG